MPMAGGCGSEFNIRIFQGFHALERLEGTKAMLLAHSHRIEVFETSEQISHEVSAGHEVVQEQSLA